MTNTFVMMIDERATENDLWKRRTVIVNEPFTEKEWQEKVIDAKDFFAEIGGEETHPDDRTIEYINSTKLRKIVYQLQDTEERQQNIDTALTKALSDFAPATLLEIFTDDFAEGRFDWKKDVEFLNQTSHKELQKAIDKNEF